MSRGLTRAILLVVVPCIAIAGAGAYWLYGGRYVSTENAYVKADIVQVTAEVAGRLTEVRVKDHSRVNNGDILLKVDPEPFELALLKAEAELDQTRTAVEVLRHRKHRPEQPFALMARDLATARSLVDIGEAADLLTRPPTSTKKRTRGQAE